MGSAASTLSSEQTGHLAHTLKEKYEEYQKQDMTEDEIRLKLSAEYNQLVSISEASVSKKEASKPQESKPLAKFNGKGKGAKGRRRSFDNNSMGGKPVVKNIETSIHKSIPDVSVGESPTAATTPSPTLMGSESMPALTPSPSRTAEIVDSWDSVTQQPFCTVCQMAFKSDAFLDRHVKFSDLHIKNVLKKEQKDSLNPLPSVAAGPEAATVVVAALPDVVAKQTEGEDFKMIYQGSKLFWRTQDNIDFHFYLHVLPHTIEVIPFDSQKNRELSRIYLDYTTLFDNLSKSSEDFVDGDDEAKRTMLTTHILQHLQLHSVTGESTVSYVKLSGDENIKSPILTKPSTLLVPVVVTRRRRTNAEEIETTMRGLVVDRKALVEATDTAGKVAILVHSCVKLFNENTQIKWYAHLNPVRQRWIKAIRLVIRRILVAKTKKVLAERNRLQHKQNVMGKAKEIH
jgi:hypothetical protein